MSAIKDRESPVMVDLSTAVNSADALRLLEEYLEQTGLLSPDQLVELNTGELLLTPGVLSKIQGVMKRFGVNMETLYSSVPQTQQYALDEGLLVRRTPPRPKTNYRERLLQELASQATAAPNNKGVELPFAVPKLQLVADDSAEKPASRLAVAEGPGGEEARKTVKALSMETVFYKQNLRSGQVLESSGNVVVVGDVHSGSEILADGDILVWGFLGGIAHAGRNGNDKAEIRAHRIEAVQLRIGDYFARRPDRLFRQVNKRSKGVEIARVIQDEIQIFGDELH